MLQCIAQHQMTGGQVQCTDMPYCSTKTLFILLGPPQYMLTYNNENLIREVQLYQCIL